MQYNGSYIGFEFYLSSFVQRSLILGPMSTNQNFPWNLRSSTHCDYVAGGCRHDWISRVSVGLWLACFCLFFFGAKGSSNHGNSNSQLTSVTIGQRKLPNSSMLNQLIPEAYISSFSKSDGGFTIAGQPVRGFLHDGQQRMSRVSARDCLVRKDAGLGILGIWDLTTYQSYIVELLIANGPILMWVLLWWFQNLRIAVFELLMWQWPIGKGRRATLGNAKCEVGLNASCQKVLRKSGTWEKAICQVTSWCWPKKLWKYEMLKSKMFSKLSWLCFLKSESVQRRFEAHHVHHLTNPSGGRLGLIVRCVSRQFIDTDWQKERKSNSDIPVQNGNRTWTKYSGNPPFTMFIMDPERTCGFWNAVDREQ